MPPLLAFALCLFFVIVVFRYDRARNPELSGALWAPFLWMLLIATRNASQWLSNLQTGNQPAEQFAVYMQGSNVDRAVYLLLILWGLGILFKRRVRWFLVFKKNWVIILFFAYCGISVLWSDFAGIALKRWIKGAGDYIMALVVLTETLPAESIKALIRRSAIILVPFSILLIRYFPYGRIFTPWGHGEYVGVTTSKNMLGTLSLIFGLYVLWILMTKQLYREDGRDGKEYFGYLFYLALIFWLLIYAPSMTSIICLALGFLFILVMRSSMVRRNKKYFGYIFVYVVFLFSLLHVFADKVPDLLAYFGRDVTLTGRIPLWKQLLSMDVGTWGGTGYESFWLGSRLEGIWDQHWWMPNQAHNGFIEIYLNLGRIGLFLIFGILFTTYRKAVRELDVDYNFGLLKMAVLFIMLVYSQFEAAFRGQHIMWFLLLLVAMEYTAGGTGPPRVPVPEPEPEPGAKRIPGERHLKIVPSR